MSSVPRPDPAPLSYFDPGDGRRIAYRLRPANPKVTGPTLMFLPGYASDMEGTKASEIDVFAAASGLAYLRLDYSGTGSSGGEFAEGTLDRWLERSSGDYGGRRAGAVLIGSSMGGWLAPHAALKRPPRQGGGRHAAAPDFTDWGYTAEQKAELQDQEVEQPTYGPEPQVTHRLLGLGAEMRLLHKPILLDPGAAGPRRRRRRRADRGRLQAAAGRPFRRCPADDHQMGRSPAVEAA
jgi:pimeloyl-ACP methyl ester carboxylesterase